MAEEPSRGSHAIKLMYVCMYFKQRFYRPVTVLESLKRFLHIIARKKGEPTIQKHLTLHQPVLKCSKSNERSIFNKRVRELRLAYGKVIWVNEVKTVLNWGLFLSLVVTCLSRELYWLISCNFKATNCRYFSAADSYVKIDTTSAKENINAYPAGAPNEDIVQNHLT